jgi:hypothetical protein
VRSIVGESGSEVGHRMTILGLTREPMRDLGVGSPGKELTTASNDELETIRGD